MGNDVAGIFCNLTEAKAWRLPGNTDKNYRRLQSPDRDANYGTPEQQHERSPLDEKSLRSRYGFHCFNLYFYGQ
jgi:hypothetical protein